MASMLSVTFTLPYETIEHHDTSKIVDHINDTSEFDAEWTGGNDGTESITIARQDGKIMTIGKCVDAHQMFEAAMMVSRK